MTIPAERPGGPLDSPTTRAPDLDGHLLQIIAGGRPPVDGAPSRRSRQRVRRYRRFLDALGIAVYTTDANGRITFFNEAAATFWGRRPAVGEAWCGSLRLYWPGGERMRHDECPVAIALDERRPVHGMEAMAERPDGSRVAFVAYPTPLYDDRDRLIGAVNVLVDITARRHAEESLRATAHALEASDAARDEFLGLVSHELRTPVTTILGNAHLLSTRAERLPEDVKAAMVADIAEDAERLHAIIENLLQLNRLSGGPQPDREPQVLARLVTRTVEAFRGRHSTRRIALATEPRGTVVEADRMHLELLLGNLLANAHRYSPAGAEIEVEVTVVGREAIVSVRDRGIGLGDATEDDLFAPFYRGEAAKRTANGVGLGLAVCQRIVHSLDGRIWARPRAGGGAEIGFALPAVADLWQDERALD